MDNFINALRQFISDIQEKGGAVYHETNKNSSGADQNRDLVIQDVNTTSYNGAYSSDDVGSTKSGKRSWTNLAVDDQGDIVQFQNNPDTQRGRVYMFTEGIDPQLLMDAYKGDQVAAARVRELQDANKKFNYAATYNPGTVYSDSDLAGDGGKGGGTSTNEVTVSDSKNVDESETKSPNTTTTTGTTSNSSTTTDANSSDYDWEYTYKPGDTFGQVLLDLGASDGSNLWGPAGDVAYYTQQLRDQDMLDARGNVRLGKKFRLKKRPANV